MNIFLYDKTFEGLLTLIFDSYKLNLLPDAIKDEKAYQAEMFAQTFYTVTDRYKAERVWNGIKRKSRNYSENRIYYAFLSELAGIELVIYKYIKLVFDSKGSIDSDYGNDIVLQVNQISKKVVREAQRVHMFTRFQKTMDDIYYASFDPEYNVLPLAIKHFEDRFSDQKWVIYDIRRDYGFYYDQSRVEQFSFAETSVNRLNGQISKEVMSGDEKSFQILWKNYYDSINIKERKNLKVHFQFLPKRFWKFLPEKNLFLDDDSC